MNALPPDRASTRRPEAVFIVGPEVQARGQAALARLEQQTLDVLPGGARLVGPELEALVADLNLEAVVRDLPMDRLATPASLLRGNFAGMAENPLLVRLAAESDGDLHPGLHPDALVKALPYAHLLNVLVHVAITEPVCPTPLLDRLSAALLDRRATTDWTPHSTLFERLKVATIDRPIQGRIAHKRGTAIAPGLERTSDRLVALNILEALFQDARQGCADNAEAGFELIVEAAGLAPFEPATGHAPNGSWNPGGAARGVMTITPPLPVAWCDLYQSWNLAFCSTMANPTAYFMKLLVPSVSLAYREAPGTYLARRIVALHVHIHRVMVDRASCGAPPPTRDAAALAATRRWGALNRVAAEEYRAAIHDASSPDRRAIRAARRRNRMRLWQLVRVVAPIGAGPLGQSVGTGAGPRGPQSPGGPMHRRTFLLALGGGAALLSLGSMVRKAPPSPSTSPSPGGPLADVYRRAEQSGRALLVLIVPDDEAHYWSRGQRLGSWLVHGAPEHRIPLHFCELACGTVAEVQALVPGAELGTDPWVVLVETDGQPPQVQSIRPTEVEPAAAELSAAEVAQLAEDNPFLQELKQTSPEAVEQALPGLAAREKEDRLARQELATLGGPVRDALVPDGRTFRRRLERLRATDPSTADLLAKWTLGFDDDRDRASAALVAAFLERAHGETIPGSKWATATGCGTYVRDEPGPGYDCGMGHVPALSREFLYFFHRGT